jgi:XTP/dITP diphosphohydrolase
LPRSRTTRDWSSTSSGSPWGVLGALGRPPRGRQANLELLLAQLEDVPEQPPRRAVRVRGPALVTPAGEEYVEVAEIGDPFSSGRRDTVDSATTRSSSRGYSRSMASLTPAEKNAISHRGKAFRALADEIASVISRG